MKRALSIFLLLLSLCVHHQARAQGSSSKAAAEALYQQGKSLFDAQKYAEACEKFDASQKLDPAIGTLLFLGDCYEKQNKKASAWASFKEAASLAQARNDDRQKIAEVRAAALLPQVSRLIIRVSEPTLALERFTLRRDGVEMPTASLGAPLPVDAGTVKLEAVAAGHEPYVTTVTVPDGGKEITVDIPMLTARAGPTPSPLPTVPEPDTSAEEADDGSASTALLVSGIAVGALGLAGVAVGSAFGIMARDSRDASLMRCRTETFCSAEGVTLRDDAQDEATVSTITFIVGGVLAAGGITLVVLSQTVAREPEKSGSTRLEVVPLAGPTLAGLSLRGQF